jgi:hypothetical protein
MKALGKHRDGRTVGWREGVPIFAVLGVEIVAKKERRDFRRSPISFDLLATTNGTAEMRNGAGGGSFWRTLGLKLKKTHLCC